MCDYPLEQVAAAGSSGSPAASGTTTTTTVNQDTHVVQTVTKPTKPAHPSGTVILVFKCWMGNGQYRIKTAEVDRSLLRLPECVICVDENIGDLHLKLTRTMDLRAVADRAVRAAETDIAIATRAASDVVNVREESKLAHSQALIADASAELAEARVGLSRSQKNIQQLRRAEADARRETTQAVEGARAVAEVIARAEVASKAQADAVQAANRAVAAADENQALVADAGAFGSESDDDFLHENTAQHTTPFLNPALIFGLVSTAAPPDCNPGICALGTAGRHRFYGNDQLVPNPRLAFHEFVLLVSQATIVGQAVPGAKPVIAYQTSPNGILLQ